MVSRLRTLWHSLSPLPFGKWLFSKMVGLVIPYTGTISPHVLKIGPGFAEVSIRDRRRNCNHLSCLHALALANLGEFTTGLAIHFAMEDDDRAILTELSTKYLKKARGKILAQVNMKTPLALKSGPLEVEANLLDQKGDLVATVRATWLLGKSSFPLS